MTKSNLKVLFGQKIKSLRESVDLTQEQLAEKILLERDTISKIENGKRFPSCNSLQNISEVLNISYSELFNFENYDNNKNLDNAILVETKTLNPEQAEFVLDFIRLYKKSIKN